MPPLIAWHIFTKQFNRLPNKGMVFLLFSINRSLSKFSPEIENIMLHFWTLHLIKQFKQQIKSFLAKLIYKTKIHVSHKNLKSKQKGNRSCKNETKKKELHEALEVPLWTTWIKTTVWPLERRFSAAHFRAFWLPLSLSIATATSPFPAPFFTPFPPFPCHIFSQSC